ncbi:MAG: DNA polymerase I [Chlorobiales bacterium]|nr:DNA polymerase I [Chlorobiales bacterium]
MVSLNNTGQFQLTFDMNTASNREHPAAKGKKPSLFLLDGMALVYRSFFALQRTGMATKEGTPTGATYGFLVTLLKIHETYRPNYLAAAFDSAEKTFRHKLYEPYKANRPEPPEDLIAQLDVIFRLVEAMRIPVLKQPGYEADDLIGSAARKFEQQCTIYIVTPDKDLAQLVHDGVKILKPGKKQNGLELLGNREIKEQFGVPPERFIDFLTLTGDSSDNIPGAKGIGPKTASKLLDAYGSLEAILKHLDELPPKSRKSLEEFETSRPLIQDLVTVRTDLPLATTLYDLECEEPDGPKLFNLLDTLEMKSVATRIPQIFPGTRRPENSSTNGSDPEVPPTQDVTYRLIDDEDGVRNLEKQLANLTGFAIDTETTSLNTLEAELVGMSVSWKPGEAHFIYCPEQGLSPETVLDILRGVLENRAIEKKGQNLKYDILVLKNYGIRLSPVGFDSMLASYVLNPEEKHNLDDLADQHLGYRTTTYSELTGKGKNAITIREVPVDKLTAYACQDADVALRLQQSLSTILSKNTELDHLCRHIEFPLVEVLADMEFRGISLDTFQLERTAKTVNRQIEDLTERIYETAGISFNIDSPKQLGNILFNVLGLPAKKTTKTGYSTDVRVLEDLALLHPVAKDVLEYRSLQKLKTTYIEALPKMLCPKTGRLHTSFNQHIAATGRLSSSNPNLQNIPIRTPLGREIRKAFIPSDENNYLLSADYSQIELRIAAEISEDPQLITAFKQGEDIHAATARTIFDTMNISDDMRRKAKEVNFGVLYGIQPYGLAQRLNIPQKEAKAIIETYKSKFPGLFEALEKIKSDAAEKGYVTTLIGRRRYINNLQSRNRNIRMAAERAAMNTPIQGTAADIIKCAMTLTAETIKKHRMRSSMLLQVHDELVFETTQKEKETLSTIAKECMIQAAEMCGLANVPVEVEIGIGKNWLDAH